MTSAILLFARNMPRSPKKTNKKKLQALKLLEAASTTAVAVAAAVGVDRSTLHRWKKDADRIAASSPSQCFADPRARAHVYVQQPELEQRLLEWIVNMRKNRYLCVSTNCLLLMHSKFAPALFASRSQAASLMFIRRFLKRNRLTVRRITHKGRKKRSDMEEVANVFSHSILRTVEEDGILSYINGPDKYASVYNMDQTAVYIDMNGRTTVDFVGAQTGDVVQESAINVFRVSVFLAASATEVFNPAFGAAAAEHTVQKNAYCDATVMLDWIERVWKPSVDGLFSSTKADAKACTTAGSVWNYKFDTTSIIWRAFARYFMISDFPDCLFYREKCFTETLCGESSKGSPPHYQICAGPTAFSPHTVALHLAAYRQTSKMNPADRLIIVLLMEMLSGDTSAPAAASNLLNQAHELEVAFVTGLLAPQHREWLAKERSGHWAHMLFSSRLYFDSSMKELFRMDSSSIAALFKAVCPGMVPTRDAPDAVVPPKRLAVFLYVCAHGSSVRVTADKFAIGPATVSVIVKDLAAIVCSLLSSLVAFPPFRLCASHFARSAGTASCCRQWLIGEADSVI
ncbi:hypothetical protein PF008_g16467 [Phytophthora fragariae]|uniref:HTH CENPB-type domain-containing protein n=1 Tax=Phytophthora fragariae TaxID=53985 RepID=A0A6G0RB17_9STRA|nr:hypothetical protein PF008_g16467 [Phytophthora fragariae]